jgi:hypothetical protein
VGRGPRREGDGANGETVEQVNPSLSTPSLVRGGKPEGTLVQLSWLTGSGMMTAKGYDGREWL